MKSRSNRTSLSSTPTAGFSLAAALVILAAGLPRSAHAATVVADWRFNGNTNDSSVNGNNGTITGSTSYVTGKSGQAIRLENGAGVTIPVAAALPLGANSSWTINLWLAFSSAPAPLLSLAGFGQQNGWAPEITGTARSLTSNVGDANIFFWQINSPSLDGGTTYIGDGTFHMYTISSENTGATGTAILKIYRDSTLVATSSPLNNIRDAFGTSIFVGGTSQWGKTWAGSVDEFTLWNGALTQTEVNTLYAVPEPSAYGLLLLSMSSLCLNRRRIQA